LRAGDIPKIPLNLALLKGCDIRGVFWGAHGLAPSNRPLERTAPISKSSMKWAAEGKISSHVDSTFPLAQDRRRAQGSCRRARPWAR
jgi:NADPH2:quinone reductase